MSTAHETRTGDARASGIPGGSALEIARDRLDEPLEALAAGTITGVTVWAAAGAGKSILIAHWARTLAGRGETVLWAACGDAHGSALHADAGDDAMDCGVVRALASARETEGTVYVIVDDAHLIASSRARAELTRALEDDSGTVHVVVAGRYRPIAGLAHLQAAGRIVELGTEDLAFDAAEAGVLAGRHGVHLSAETAAALAARTGGWATALALAMPWLARSADASAAVTEFSGDDGAVADYLVTEVLAGLDERTRSVMTATAVAPFVPVELAAELSGIDDVVRVLHEVALTNALVVEVAHGFRFHPVLLAFLRAEARRLSRSDAAAQHAGASAWFLAHEQPAEALAQALNAVPEVLAATLDEVGLELALMGRSRLVASALGRFAVDDTAPLPALVLQLLLDAPAFADARRAHHLLALADRVAASDPARRDAWNVALDAVRCFVEVRDRRSFAGVSRLSDALAIACRESDLGLDLLCAAAEAQLFSRIGETARAQGVLRDVRVTAHRAGLDWLFLVAGELEIAVLGDLGRFDEAVVIEDGFLELAGRIGRRPADRMRLRVESVAATRAYLSCGEIDVSSLERLAAADPLGLDPELSVTARLLAVLPSLDADQNPRRALDDCERLMREAGVYVPRLLAIAAPRLIALRMMLDGRARAKETAELVVGVLGADSLEGTLARFLLSVPLRGTDPVVRQLERALHGARAWHPASFVSAWLWLARFAHDAGRIAEADAAVLQALEAAERFRLVRPFLARTSDGIGLLAQRTGRLGHHEATARRILQLAPRAPAPASAERALDSLTPKERDILLELPVHQSVAEIAARHSLSVNTVKTHLRNIYQKLGVTDRSEAVAEAMRLGLI